MIKKLKYLLVFHSLFCSNILLPQESDEYYYLMLFSNILNHIKSNYIEEVPADQLFTGAINGVFQKLDPHTIYLPEERLKKFLEISGGSACGVGIEFEIINNQPTVISVIEDSPADSKNIRTGDILIEINKAALSEQISSAELALQLYGEPDTKVNLTLRRGKSLYNVSLKRVQLDITSVPVLSIMENGIGYIKCTNFSKTTPKEILDALKKFEKEDVKGLALDLRDNPGGILESTVKIADFFLPAGKQILYSSGRKDEMIKNYLAEDKINYEMPMVLLINSGSASASEVLAGALQDNGRAKIIGTPSFGKGLIQTTFLLDNGGAILMTIGEYRTPSGRKVQRNYKGLSFEEYYKGSENNDTLKTGGIQPDILQSQGSIIDSIMSSSEDLITQKAVSYIQEFQPAAKYSNYVTFKNTFDEKELNIPPADLIDSDYNKSLRLQIKSKIAGMIWGDTAEFDCGKELDLQLQSAIRILNKETANENIN